MIIIEGADNSGKTMLGLRLCRDLGIPLVHSTRADPSLSPPEVLNHSISQLFPKMKIQDRVYAISEAVYGPICRGRSDLGEYHRQALEDLMSRTYQVIYCRPPLERILDNKGREQMEGVLEHHEEIVERYDQVMRILAQSSVLDVTTYDWTRDSYYSLVRSCQIYLKEMSLVQLNAKKIMEAQV